LAADDFSRQSPASSDFTSGGVFVDVNDVAGYNVWRQAVGDAEATLIAELGAGQTAYVDEAVTSGVNYVYLVTAIDGSGNESAPVESEAVSLGPPPAGGKPTVDFADFAIVAADEVASETFEFTNSADDQEAVLPLLPELASRLLRPR
jgi:hypothetical protein